MGKATERRLVAATDANVDAEIRRLTRRGFAVGAMAALGGGSALAWLVTRATEDGVRWPLRRMLEFDEGVAQTFFSPSRLAPEFPAEQAVEPRVNGRVGLVSPAAIDDWTIHVVGKVDRHVPLTAIRKLPAYEMTTQLKCVEGWSRIVRWKGARLAEFLDQFGSPADCIGMSTPPDGGDARGRADRYYVGLDRASALHPQTLLCYEMNGQPLTEDHGAPLRLISTVKYGYKCIKRASVIELSDSRTADYWAERGYDWYAGL